MDFTTQYCNRGPYHVSGSIGQDAMYNGVALLGFNLNQAAAGASIFCIYDPGAATRAGRHGDHVPHGPRPASR